MTTEQAAVLEAVKAGASIDEAARQAGRPVATVRRWLMQGRKRPDGNFGELAAAVDKARGERRHAERALKGGPLTPSEAELLLAKAARKGSVPALRLWFEQRVAGEGKQRGDEARRLLESVFGEDS
jgi:transposase-like protein